MNNKIILGAVATVATIASVGTVSAASNPEVRTAIKNAISENNYPAFQEAANESRIIEKVGTQEKFDMLVEAKKLKESGDYEAARAIKNELGLKKGRGGKNPEVRAAIEANDYTAFQAVIPEERKKAEVIDSQEKFDRLVEAYKLKEAGDREGAKAIKDELGLGDDHEGKEGRGHKGDRENR